MEPPIVTLTQGQVKGKTAANYVGEPFFSFLGIPYAQAPIGPLRFKDPKPPEPWTGIFDATKEGNECPSMHMLLGYYVGNENNCLNLNVFTKTLSEEQTSLKPVMVFIHGGGFTQGSNKQDVYGPDYLLSEDIVLVVINYRLGPFGFLSLDDKSLEIPGNAGLKDQVLALKWVQNNIKMFGGDPTNVTIFGESAGAASVHYLVLSPLAKGLFHKAILQSGCAINFWAQGRKGAEEICKQLGCKLTDQKEMLQYLQNAPAEKIALAANKSTEAFAAGHLRYYGPVIEEPSESAFITDTPLNIIKSGSYNKVPMIIGYNSMEGILFEAIRKLRPEAQLPSDFKMEIPFNLVEEKNLNLEEIAATVKKFYLGDEEPTEENIQKIIKMKSDTTFTYGIHLALRNHLKTTQEPIYLYRMSLDTDIAFYKRACTIKWVKSYFVLIFLMKKTGEGVLKNGILRLMSSFSRKQIEGVSHADDLSYLFKMFLAAKIIPGSLEEVYVKRFVKLWTNFARFGKPTPPENSDGVINVAWEPTGGDLDFLDIGKELGVGKNPDKEAIEFWDQLLGPL